MKVDFSEQAVNHVARLVESVSDPAMAATGIELLLRADGSLGLIVMMQGDKEDVHARRSSTRSTEWRPAESPTPSDALPVHRALTRGPAA